MRLPLLACFWLVFPMAVRAAEPSDVLKFVPRQAEFVVVVDRPLQAIQAAAGIEPLHELLTFDAVKEQFDSTNARRFRQLIAHLEKSLGRDWQGLIDDIAGGGAALAMRFDGEPPAAMLVLKSKDAVRLRRTFDMLLDVVKSEQERTESAERVRSQAYRGVTTHRLGKDAFAAVAGPVFFFSNKLEAVKLGIDLYINGAGESLARTGKTDAAKAVLPPNPLAWSYLDLERAHNTSEGQEAYRYPKGDPGQLVLFQGMLDVIGRSPFVATATHQTPTGIRTTIRMPAGRTATPDGLSLHLPPTGHPGSLPLLEPKNTLFSTSFYLDVGKVWTQREKLLDESLRKQLEEADAKIGRFLAGKKLAELLTSIGPYHRFVAVAREQSGYGVQPDTLQPAFAVVSDVRDSNYPDAMNAILRTTALLAGGKYKLKLSEEKIGANKLVVYRFPENRKAPEDAANTRFNFSPCFARVGNQFLVASTAELGRELVEQLAKPGVAVSEKTTRMRFSSAGGAALMRAFEDRLVTQTILERATTVEEARREAKKFIAWLHGLGTLDLEIEYGPSDFRYDISLRWRSEAKP